MRTITIDVSKVFIYPLQGKYVNLFFPEAQALGAILFIRFAEFKIQLRYLGL